MSDLLLLGQMARRLGVEAEWLRQEAEAGRVPCLRAGKRFLFNSFAVQDALAARASFPSRPASVDASTEAASESEGAK